MIRYKTTAKLRKLLHQNSCEKNVKRIVIADLNTREAIKDLMKNKADIEMFRDVRVLDMKIPNMEKMSENQKTALQAQMVMIAILGRLLTKDNTEQNLCVKALLKEMLGGCFENKKVLKNFMRELAVPENEQTTLKQIKSRIYKFLKPIRTIDLIKELDHKLRLIEYFMRFA